jgi:hypothetical protein
MLITSPSLPLSHTHTSHLAFCHTTSPPLTHTHTCTHTHTHTHTPHLTLTPSLSTSARQDLAHTWAQLSSAGCPKKSLKPLGQALFQVGLSRPSYRERHNRHRQHRDSQSAPRSSLIASARDHRQTFSYPPPSLLLTPASRAWASTSPRLRALWRRRRRCCSRSRTGRCRPPAGTAPPRRCCQASCRCLCVCVCVCVCACVCACVLGFTHTSRYIPLGPSHLPTSHPLAPHAPLTPSLLRPLTFPSSPPLRSCKGCGGVRHAQLWVDA